MALTRGIGAFDDGTALVPGVGTNPIDVRKSLGAIFSATGVMPGGPSPLVTGTSGWAYSVAGPVYFVTSRGASDGVQFYSNDGAAVIGTTGVGSTVPVAPGAGLQRIDIAWTRHPTNTENGDSSSAPIFGVASGLAASTALPPTIPAGALEIGRNLMLSAATSTASSGNTISQSATVAALRGTADSQPRAWEVVRAAGADAPFTTAMTNLVGPSGVGNVPAGTYRITGRVVLYSTSGAIGNAFITAGAQTQLVRNDVDSPGSIEISMVYTHAGGSLTIAAGYDVAGGTAVCMGGPNQNMVRAEFLGA